MCHVIKCLNPKFRHCTSGYAAVPIVLHICAKWYKDYNSDATTPDCYNCKHQTQQLEISIMTEQETVLSLENQTPILENPSIVLLPVYFVVKEYVSS
jgi:hypothetical protein